MVLIQTILRNSKYAFRQLNKPSIRTQFWRNFSVSALNNSERKFSDKHEWIIVDGDIGTVGISEYAQEALGDVVFAQLPDVGSNYRQHEECGALESVKAASEVYTPVSGDVTEKNRTVEDSPSLVNTSCYDKGWLFKIKLTKPKELETLMTEEAYEEFLKNDN